jgi:hypothetical protein
MGSALIMDLVAACRTQMREAGFVRVSVWVPEDRYDEIQEVARKLREEAARAPRRGEF